MSRITDTIAYDRDQPVIRPIVLGGTGAVTRPDAAISLAGVSSDALGQANGVASLNSSVKVPLSQLPIVPGTEAPALDGPDTVIVGSSNQTALSSDVAVYGAYHADGAVMRIRLTGLGSELLFIGPGNEAAQEYKYVASDLDPINSPAYFGCPVLINANDTEMIVGSYYKHWSSNYSEDGAVYVFR